MYGSALHVVPQEDGNITITRLNSTAQQTTPLPEPLLHFVAASKREDLSQTRQCLVEGMRDQSISYWVALSNPRTDPTLVGFMKVRSVNRQLLSEHVPKHLKDRIFHRLTMDPCHVVMDIVSTNDCLVVLRGLVRHIPTDGTALMPVTQDTPLMRAAQILGFTSQGLCSDNEVQATHLMAR